jgi:hypothetical protein
LANTPVLAQTGNVIAALQLILVGGLAYVVFWLLLQIRAWRRSKIAGRMMTQTLRTSVRNQNARQAIAGLREKRDVKVLPLESAMALHADLSQRVEEIRLRVLARSAAPSGETGTSRTAEQSGQSSGGRFGVRAHALCSVAGMVDRRLLGHPG